MSLLLEALKKAEREKEEKAKAEGGEAAAPSAAESSPAQPAAAMASEAAPQAAAPAVAATPPPAASSAVAPSAPAAAAPPPTAAAPAPAAASGGFALKTAPAAPKAPAPALPDESAAPGGAPVSRLQETAQTKRAARKRVTAGRIFQARADTGQPKSRRRGLALAAVLAVAAIGAGAYYQFVGFPQLQDQQVAKAPPKIPQVQLDEVEAEELLPLSSPVVDIQSELLDYAALQVPGDGDATDTIAQRLAILTGAAVQPAGLDSGIVDVEDLNVGLADLEEGEEQEDLFDPAEAPLVSAISSRVEKARLDAQSAVDIEITKTDDGQGEAVEEAPPPAIEKVAADIEATDNDEEIAERHALLRRAQADYRAGRLTEAEAKFRRVLHEDDNNLDALRGLAQVAAAGGRFQLAASVYLQILESYPKDPVAIAELINLQARQVDPELSEERLQGLLGLEPAADARIYFALGNIYAESGRWLKAQGAYFEALTRDSENPDYVYNLAVTLDYLNKRALALRYYREAVSLTDGGAPSGFDPASARARIADLEK